MDDQYPAPQKILVTRAQLDRFRKMAETDPEMAWVNEVEAGTDPDVGLIGYNLRLPPPGPGPKVKVCDDPDFAWLDEMNDQVLAEAKRINADICAKLEPVLRDVAAGLNVMATGASVPTKWSLD